MAVRTAAVVEERTIRELKVGDKVLQDVVGYKQRVLIYAGTTLSVSHIEFIKKQLARAVPTLPSEKYLTGTKAKARIKDANGKTLVEPGAVIKPEAMAPLLKEGFVQNETMEANVYLFSRKQEFKGGDTSLEKLNPRVRVETMALVDDKVTAKA